VMNTDNLSILGLTIDYGPYGWVDDFDPGWTPNTTDAQGKRYAFGRQPGVALWNLARLGDALATLDAVPPEALTDALAQFERTYAAEANGLFAEKFGLRAVIGHGADASEAEAIIDAAFALMTQHEIDMTIFFRSLASATTVADLRDAFYRDTEWHEARAAWAAWFNRYAALGARLHATPDARAERAARMNAVNPKYVLRNYLAQQVIDSAHAGDYAPIAELLDVMRRPYDEQPGRERFAHKRPDWARTKAGCSMLSCSS